MPLLFFRQVIALSATASLAACIGLDSARQAPPTYQPQVATDGTNNPQLAKDIQDCQKCITQDTPKDASAQQWMVLMRGCLIQRGHIMLN